MRTKSVNIKMTENEFNLIKERQIQLGFQSFSEYVRYVAMNTTKIERNIRKHKENEDV